MNKIKPTQIVFLFILILILSSCLHQGPLNLVSYKKQGGVGYRVWVDDDYAYMTNNDGVVIFDVHRPERPVKVSEISTGITSGVYVKNGMAYISRDHGLSIFDVSNPEWPTLVGEYSNKHGTHALYLEGDYIYLTSEKGLDILNVQNPAEISLVAHFNYNDARAVAVVDETVYLASLNGVVVIDVTDPVSPQKIRALAYTNGAWDMHVNGDLLYVGRHRMEISVFTIHNPEEPHYAGSFLDHDAGEALGVWGQGNYLFVADNYGIEVLDMTDPTQPFEVDEYSSIKGAHDIHVYENYVYAATASKGLLLLQFSEMKEP